MTLSDEHKEKRVQDTLALMRENPRMKATKAARQSRASYSRVLRKIKGVPRSSSHEGHNKKLDKPKSKVLREYLLICHSIGRGAGIDNVIALANSILCY
jgi:hypothetical protein